MLLVGLTGDDRRVIAAVQVHEQLRRLARVEAAREVVRPLGLETDVDEPVVSRA